MRIALKLALAIIALVVALLAIEALLRSAREAAIYEQDLRRDQRILAHAFEHIGELVWRLEGIEQARLLLSAAATPEADFDARIVDEATAMRRLGESVDDPAAAWARDEMIQLDEPTVLRTYVRLEGPGGERQALEISTSLQGERAFLLKGLREFGIIAAVLLAVTAALATWLGRLLVGRRVDRLVAHTQRLGHGDFAHVESAGTDEIGQLGRALNEMADTLARARAALEDETRARVAATDNLRRSERLATVGTLAAGLAHELGTPLHVVAGRARLIADEATGDTAISASVIIEQAARLQRIIEQLLDFARTRHAERRSVAIASLVAADLELLAPIFQRRRVTTRVERRCDEGASVFGDPDQLRQVFTNILINAAHAMPQGGVIDIRVEAGLPAPAGLEREAGRFIRVTITDQGVGISPENITRVFDPFFTTKDVGEGTGLGLAVAYGIIADHGGLISADSTPGQGSTFCVWLPEEAR